MSIDVGFDLTEFELFNQQIIKLARERFPRESKSFLRRAGKKLEKRTKDAYDKEIKAHKDNMLIPQTKRGQPYIYGQNEYSVRVKCTAPHAHLIEHGHVLWAKGRPTNQYVKGKKIVSKQVKEFKEEYADMTDDFIDEILDKGL